MAWRCLSNILMVHFMGWILLKEKGLHCECSSESCLNHIFLKYIEPSLINQIVIIVLLSYLTILSRCNPCLKHRFSIFKLWFPFPIILFFLLNCVCHPNVFSLPIIIIKAMPNSLHLYWLCWALLFQLALRLLSLFFPRNIFRFYLFDV